MLSVVALDVLTLTGSLACKVFFPRTASVLQMRHQVSREVDVPPSEFDLIFGMDLADNQAQPLREAADTAVATMLRRVGVTLLASRKEPFTEEALTSMCSPHAVNVCLGESCMDAYLTCENDDQAKAIIRAVSKTDVCVTWATKPALRVTIEGMKMLYRLTETDIKELFSRFCEVDWVFVEPQGLRAEVTARCTAGAEHAIRSLDGRWLEALRGTLRVSWASSTSSVMASAKAPEIEIETCAPRPRRNGRNCRSSRRARG